MAIEIKLKENTGHNDYVASTTLLMTTNNTGKENYFKK